MCGLGDVPIRSDGTRTISSAISELSRTFGHRNGIRARQWPPHRLHPGHQACRRLDAERRQSRQGEPAKVPVRVPPGVKVSYEFDQSPYVTRAILGLTEEGLLGAVLTG